MEYYVDIADIETVRAVNDCFPIDGFTTNPNILTKAVKPLPELFAEYRAYIMETGQKLFVQVTTSKAEEMVAQAVKLRDYFGEHLVVKLPAIREGYRACKRCKALGIPVCVTVVHSTMQALMAAKAGADYTAPYISHIDNIGADGVHCVDEIVRAFDRSGYICKVLGASFRTVEQVDKLAIVGCHAVTITPETFDMLIAHPSTDVSMAGFNNVWCEKFGERQVTDFLPE
ncbi:MAG: transaldolase family protein [Clostridia bacterium]|nr:transaldolase family protein [Clostridia bacterium]